MNSEDTASAAVELFEAGYTTDVSKDPGIVFLHGAANDSSKRVEPAIWWTLRAMHAAIGIYESKRQRI